MTDPRRALPNTVLRQVRELDFQMSRMEFASAVRKAGEELGEHVGCQTRLVAAWEDGEVDCPRAVYRRILTQMTGRSMAQLGFRTSPAPSAGTVNTVTVPREESDPVERRDFLLDGAGVALGLPFGADDTSPGKIGATHVRAVTRAVSVLYEQDHDHGSAMLRQAASRALHTAYQWLQTGTYTGKTERKLRSAVGALSIAAGWLSYDSGRPGDAHSLYGEALAAARIADDPELESHAFGCLSLLAKAQGRPREAVAAAQGAQTVARHIGSARLLSLFHMREAGGWALAGDAGATDRAIVKSHRLYAQGPSDADPAWLGFFAPGELAGLESLARADLGQHERAAAGAEQAVMLHGGTFARNSALYTADVAIQHAVRGRPEPEAAAEAAGKVLEFLPEVRSDRLLQALHNVAGALQRHNRVPAVADWIEEYRTITATAGGRA
ncbi:MULTISPECIES: hypothetical protein [unclassified Streptomyces]|uniref:hypothetical protein n=1 Tax=unclassified Streptomyces TaxID=2593676 RepID=UPI00070C944B|nr:hypothetical protein [Streptomyces sp. Root1310]KQX77069.1 hypothetical protein ASD48_38455 [Streptomyces sp. Root1310]